MSSFKKEVKLFGREFVRQGSILLFGKAPKFKSHSFHRKITRAEKQYKKVQNWAKRKGSK